MKYQSHSFNFQLALILFLTFCIWLNVRAQEITQFPYLEDFETGYAGWDINDGILDWKRGNGVTPTNYTGPSEAYQSMYYMYIEANDASCCSSGFSGLLESPKMRIDGAVSAEFRFKYHMYMGSPHRYASDDGEKRIFRVQLSINQGVWTTLMELEGNQGNGWNNATFQLSDYLPKNDEPVIVQFRFDFQMGYYRNYYSDMAIDRVELKNVEYLPGYGGNQTTSYGWQLLDTLGLALPTGNIAINSDAIDTNHELWVNGSLKASEVLIAVDSIPDYVFKKDYPLSSLKEIENYIQANHHLPDIPSKSDYKARDGVELGELNMLLLRKIEEITLHLIDMNKEMDKLKEQMSLLKN